MIALKKYWPAALALVVLWGVAAVILKASLAACDGRLTYVLDDAYIHMAIARNVAQHGVFGVTPYEFSAGSSSPLWTLALALVWWPVGVFESLPLLLNLVFASGAVVLAFLAARRGLGPGWSAALLLALVFLTPLVPLVFVGMEHCLHILLSLAFCVSAAALLSVERKSVTLRRGLGVLALAALATAARYESLFLVGPLAVLFVLRKRFVFAVMLLLAAFLPIALFGIVALAHGGYFLPNSLLIKGTVPQLGSVKGMAMAFGLTGLVRLDFFAPHVFVLVAAALGLFLVNVRTRGAWDRDQILLLVLPVATVGHLQFASTGWFYRYEAYLVFLLLFAIGGSLAAWLPRSGIKRITLPACLTLAAAVLLVVVLALPLAFRGRKALAETVDGTRNTFEKEYQMARFLGRYYAGEAVAVCDAGAVGFFGNVKMLDMVGLCSQSVMRARRERRLTPAMIEQLADERGCRVALVTGRQATVERGGLAFMPKRWVFAGGWETDPATDVVKSEPGVLFFATGTNELAGLQTALSEFSRGLPGAIIPIRTTAPTAAR